MATAEPIRVEDTRLRILDAAAGVFAEKGYHRASFSDLTEATGLTKGALYFHFPSKEALALAAFAHTQEKWVGEVVHAADPSLPAVSQLEAMLHAAVDFAERDPAGACTSRLSMELSEDPAVRPRLASHLTRWEEMVSLLIRQAQREGDLRSDVSAELAARASVAAFIGSQHAAQVTSGGRELRERAEGFLTFLMASLRNGTGSAARRGG